MSWRLEGLWEDGRGYRVRNSNAQMQGTLWPIDLVYWLVTSVVTNE